MMTKKKFDTILTQTNINDVATIIEESKKNNVTYFINVGTSLIESINSINIAQTYNEVYASIGIHPNDATSAWREDLKNLELLIKKHKKIVAIGECGIDKHYPDYNLERQSAVFMAQIELALRHDLALIVHTRDARDETLKILDSYRKEPLKGVIHCFSEDQSFAHEAIKLNFLLGIGGPLTYPKNDALREVFRTIDLNYVILETDAPFLPPQIIRGQQNHPKYIAAIAEFLTKLRNVSFDVVAHTTTSNALKLFFSTI
jgi:TatD DNase family protein